MELVHLPLDQLREAPWNPNEADAATLRRLGASLQRFGLVLPLVVRPEGDGYEVLSGNQRLRVLRAEGVLDAPCVCVQSDGIQARLLAQALNRIHGEDDLNRKAALVRELLGTMPAAEVAAILPDSEEAMRGLAAIGQASPAALGAQLAAWAGGQEARAATRLHVTSFPFSAEQRSVVEEAVSRALPAIADDGAPNRRAVALAAICADWLRGRGFGVGMAAVDGRVVSAAVTQPGEVE